MIAQLIAQHDRQMWSVARSYEASGSNVCLEPGDLYQSIALSMCERPHRKWTRLAMRTAVIDEIRRMCLTGRSFSNGNRPSFHDISDYEDTLPASTDMDAEVLWSEIHGAINRLPDRQRYAIQEWLSGKLMGEIAREWQVSESIVSRAITEATKRLKKMLGNVKGRTK